MSTDDIIALSASGAAGLGILMVLFDGDMERALWPRGLRWFPVLWLALGERLHRLALAVFWPEKLPAFKGHRLLRLESYDQQWRLWNDCAGADGPPVWEPWNAARPDDGRWVPRERSKPLCPCGYDSGSECVAWCGSGHATGACPEHDGISSITLGSMTVTLKEGPTAQCAFGCLCPAHDELTRESGS